MSNAATVPPQTTPSAPPVDLIAGPHTDELAWLDYQYRYTTGREYLLKFDKELVTFSMLDGPNYKPEFKTPVSLPYRTRNLGEGQVLVHWLVPGRSGHVAVVIDTPAKLIHVAALMPGKGEFFDVGHITDIAQRPAGTVVAKGAPPMTHGGMQPGGPSAGLTLPPFLITDAIGGEMSQRLAGKTLQCSFSTGQACRIAFTATEATSEWLTGPGAGAKLTAPYRATDLRGDIVLFHWMLPERSGHAAFALDLGKNTIAASALLAGKSEFFDTGSVSI